MKMKNWSGLRESLKRPHLESAPIPVLASVIGLFEPESESEDRKSLRNVMAALMYDSFTQPAFAGARGAAATRQVVMRAEEFDIHIRIWMAEDSRELMGQIQPRNTRSFAKTATLHLLRNGERISSAETNDLGEFHFSYVPDGFLSLQIDLPHLTVIGALNVTEDPA
jgi:hypothetical protein